MVTVLLSTYNGARYLREQIDSLLKQTAVDCLICVRDDGSNDTTPAIIKEYTMKYPDRILDLTDNKHRGYPDCFWSLLRDCPAADAYAFCDQDDVWEPAKLARARDMLGTVSASVPALYIHDYQVCDNALHPQHVHTIPDLQSLPSERILFYSYAEGFSMVMNNALRSVLLKSHPEGKHLCHDEWSLWTCCFHGRILHDPEILARYRRHEETYTTTGSATGGMIRSWFSKEISGPAFQEKCRRIVLFADTDSKITQKQKEIWYLLAGVDKSPKRYFRRLFYPHRLKPTIGGELALRILFLIQ